MLDKQSDIFNISSEFIEGEIVLRVSRLLVTTDPNTLEDIPLNQPLYWIYAYGDYDGGFVQHTSETRGVSNNLITLPPSIECPGIKLKLNSTML